MPTASVQAQRFKVLLAGVFSQILCIGIARFAYTPLLPVMQQQSWVSDADGGWLAALRRRRTAAAAAHPHRGPPCARAEGRAASGLA